MILTPRSIATGALTAALLCAAGTAPARDDRAGARPPLTTAQSGDVGPAAAAAAARNATGGTVLAVQPSQSGTRTIYRVKVLLPGGRVRTLSVDGASGQVLG